MYSTVRYFVAFALYAERDRRIALLALGSTSALSFSFILLSLLLSFFAPRLGWKHRTHSLHARILMFLSYASSLLLLGPAITNLVFVAKWRHNPKPALSSEGCCHFAIDILWTGSGHQCGSKSGIPWGYFLAGSIVRLLLTAAIVVSTLLLFHSRCLLDAHKIGTGGLPYRFVSIFCYEIVFL